MIFITIWDTIYGPLYIYISCVRINHRYKYTFKLHYMSPGCNARSSVNKFAVKLDDRTPSYIYLFIICRDLLPRVNNITWKSIHLWETQPCLRSLEGCIFHPRNAIYFTLAKITERKRWRLCVCFGDFTYRRTYVQVHLSMNFSRVKSVFTQQLRTSR